MEWVRRRFKGNKVWVQIDARGRLVETDGRVELKFRLEDDKTYAAAARRIERLEEEPLPPPPRPTAPDAADPADAIVVYTDGSCLGNPGPAGWGAYLRAGSRSKDLSGYLGEGTNNIAELTAIREALRAIKNRTRRVILHSDSTYARGVLTRSWKAKANVELITETRALIAGFRVSRCAGSAHTRG
jgi:ribonuclease HI